MFFAPVDTQEVISETRLFTQPPALVLRTEIVPMKKYENNSQGKKSKSNLANFQPPLAFTMAHILAKLHEFLISSFRDFVWTDRCTDADRQMPTKTIPTSSIAAMQLKNTHPLKTQYFT